MVTARGAWARKLLGESPLRWALYLGACTGGFRFLLHVLGVRTSRDPVESVLAGLVGGMIVGAAMAFIVRERRAKSGD